MEQFLEWLHVIALVIGLMVVIWVALRLAWVVGMLALAVLFAALYAPFFVMEIVCGATPWNTPKDEPLRMSPEQWAAWNQRAADVIEQQIRRRQVFLLPPPRQT